VDEAQIRPLLINFKNSSHYREWHSRRLERHEYNSSWIKPEKIGPMSTAELKQKFLEYYSGGEGRQTFNQIWRDRIIRDPKFKDTLLYLMDENLSLEQRFSEVVTGSEKMHIEGFGKGLASAFLMDLNIQKYCVWNNKTEMGLSVLGIELPYKASDNDGTRYIKILECLRKLKDDIGSGLNLDFDEIDHFLHWVAAEDEGKNAVRVVAGEGALTQVGIEIAAPEEKFVQQLIEQNFDNVFGPLNLKLYDKDPEQTGAQFRTPVGVIDFLAIDKTTEDFVVIELKIGKASDGAIGQLLRYIGYITENIANEKNVKGILLAEDIDDKTKYSLKMVPMIEFKKFKLGIHLL